jgi:hypothetical protein
MVHYNYKKTASFWVVCVLCFVKVTSAQVQPNFPYSSLGVGEFDNNSQGMLSGMGIGTSAIRSDNYLNNDNPASFSALAPKLVVGEASASGTAATISDPEETTKSSTFNLSRFVLGFKVAKFWGTSAGILPLSNVSYQIVSSPQAVTGSAQTISSIYEGNGGLHEAYWGNGVSIGKHLSLGLLLNYIFGSINQIEQVAYDINTPILTATQQTYLRNFNLQYGLQFYTKLNKQVNMSVGLQYQSERRLRASYNLSVISGSDTLTNQVLEDNYFTIPAEYRGGIAFDFANKLTVDADYILQQWSKVSPKDNNARLVNGAAYGIGLQYRPWKQIITYQDKVIQRMLFETGFVYNDSYLEINQQQVKDISFTLGAGFYNRPRTVSVNMGLRFGNKGVRGGDAINESYTQLYLNLILRNIWFVRTKYD